MNVDQKIQLENNEKPSTQGHLPLVLTYNETFPNIKNVIDKRCHILSINENLRNIFDKKPFIADRRNTNLNELIGGNRIFKNKVVHKNTKKPKQSGHCSPSLSRRSNLCCKQVKEPKTFESYRTKETFQIFHNLTCESENLIYLLQCRIWQLQYVGKSETPFNILLNNHRKDAKSEALILACKHFNEQNHDFQQNAEFNVTEQIKKQTTVVRFY